MFNSNINNKRISYLLIFLVFIFHLFFINFWPVNFENYFSEAAKFFYSFDKDLLKSFTMNNANTVVFSLLSSLLLKILPFLEPLQITKIISASGYIFLGIGIIRIHKCSTC